MARKPDIYQQQRQMRMQQELNSRMFEDAFPDVESITIHREFQDPDMMCTPEPKDSVFRPGQHAYFEFDCPFVECVSGGVDLASAVYEAVRSRQEVTGKAVCQGWQDRERINKYHCLLSTDYRITVTFKGDA